jgi:hypothetical protein
VSLSLLEVVEAQKQQLELVMTGLVVPESRMRVSALPFAQEPEGYLQLTARFGRDRPSWVPEPLDDKDQIQEVETSKESSFRHL